MPARLCVPGRRWLIAGLTLAVSACGADAPVDRARADAADTAVHTMDAVTAERIVREYYAALLQGRAEDARNLLAPGPRSDASSEEMKQEADAVRSLEVRRLRSVEQGEARIVVRAELHVEPVVDRASGWSRGLNTRWVELVHDRRGWRIAQIASAPIGPPTWSVVVVWAHVHILSAELALDVPHGWPRMEPEWRWAEPGGGGGEVAIAWGVAEAEGIPEPRLAADASVVRSVPLRLGWGTAVEYTVEGAPAPGSPTTHEVHVLARAKSGVRTVHLTARAASADAVAPFRSVLRRMARSIELDDPSSLTTQPPPGSVIPP